MLDQVHNVRARQNQQLFRSVNERMKELQETFAYFTERGSWVCECSGATCLEKVSMTLPEYEWVRADPRHFLVVSGHVDDDADRVIADPGRFAVVQLGDAPPPEADELLYFFRLGATPGFDYVNEVVTTWVGYTPEDHYTDSELGSKIVHPDDVDVLGRIVARPETGPARIRWVARDGRMLTTAHSIAPVMDDRGIPIAIAGRATLVGETADGAIPAAESVAER